MATNIKFGNYFPEEEEEQPKGSVNIYVGMFFDGTGNNRNNSDKTYYSYVKGNGHKIIAKSIPSDFSYTKTMATDEGGEKKEVVKVTDRDSYWNPYSNVAKLFDLYKEIKELDNKEEMGGDYYILKQYVEGIGTKKDEADDLLGSGMARGDWGVISRVEEGIKNLVKDQFKNIPKDKKINKIVFDVFGFSRGATAARHFCNEVAKKAKTKLEQKRMPGDKVPIYTGKTYVSQHAGGLLGTELKNAGYKSVEESFIIEIRFLGLFDTVISDMIVKESMGYKAGLGGVLFPILYFAPLAQEALKDIKTNLSGLRIGKVFHLKAQTEWRKNFPFTPSEQGYTLGMLGAHSDIGGGYAELDKYEPVLSFFDVKDGDQKTLTDMEKYKQFYISKDVCKNFENDSGIKFINTYDHYIETKAYPLIDKYLPIITISETTRKPDYQIPEATVYDPTKGHIINEKKESDHFILQDSRYISNKYALIPMYLMLEKAIENKVPFFDDYNKAPDVKKKFEYELPNDEMLQKYFELMKKVSKDEDSDKDGSYSMPSDMYRHICNKYLHLSAHFGGFKNDFLTVKTGDHNLLESVLFLNQPVEPTIKDGKVSYQREIYNSPQ